MGGRNWRRVGEISVNQFELKKESAEAGSFFYNHSRMCASVIFPPHKMVATI